MDCRNFQLHRTLMLLRSAERSELVRKHECVHQGAHGGREKSNAGLRFVKRSVLRDSVFDSSFPKTIAVGLNQVSNQKTDGGGCEYDPYFTSIVEVD